MLGQPGMTTAAEISIETGSAYPISRPPYRQDSIKSKAMDDAVCELLELGIVRFSPSPWASPALLELGIVRSYPSPWASPARLVAKRDGTNQLCVDFGN